MTHEHDGSSIDLERELVRYMVERRITRRQLLERIAAVGAAAALAPVIAACTSRAGGSPAVTDTPAPIASPSSAGTPGAASPSTAIATESAPPTPVPTPEKELNVYNWADYIGPNVQKKFEKKYGIKVNYRQFPDDPTQLAKIRSDGKGAGYDITYISGPDVPGLIRDGVIAKVDKSLIPNLANLGAEWANPGYDPNNEHSVPYMWWTTGYAWNPDKIKDDLTSWSALFDPRFDNHINMLDDPRECFAVAAIRLGKDINSTLDADLDAELAMLKEQRPLVRTYNTDDIGQLTGGQAWITHAWSGDYFQMLSDKPKTKYVVPSEGAVRGSDTMVVLSGAPHPVAANLWIDYNMDAKVSAENSNAIGYMGPNAAAQQYISPDILGDPAVNPAKATLGKLTEILDLGVNLKKITDRWLSLK